MIVLLVINIISAVVPFLSLLSIVLAGPLYLGLVRVINRVINAEHVNNFDVFEPVKTDFFRSFICSLLKSLFLILWSLLFIIPGIIKAFSYSMAERVLEDYPTMSGYEAIKESERIMQGHKFELFMITLSFLGWHILAIFTFGLLEFLIFPWQETTVTLFYQRIRFEK